MIILGLNAYHGDASACLLVDGSVVAAAEEERFVRVRHWAGFPAEAIRFCLSAADVSPDRVDAVAVNRDPSAHLISKLLFTLRNRPSFAAITDRARNAVTVRGLHAPLAALLDMGTGSFRAKIHRVEHHRAHLASSFFVSPFETAAVVSIDGFGDFVSTTTGRGQGDRIATFDRVTFPHSLGLFFLAVTQYLGFREYGDEYKVMGLAAYGEPEFAGALHRVIRLRKRGQFELDLSYFRHHSAGVAMTWNGGAPTLEPTFSDELVRLLGPARAVGEPVTARHQNIAASLQAVYETVFFHVLNAVYDRAREKAICLAGGCVLNSVANGQVLIRTPFEQVYVPPAPADAGGAIGAALSVWHDTGGRGRSFVMDRHDWGPEFSDAEISIELHKHQELLAALSCRIERIASEEILCRRVARDIADGKIVGWFQGRMEWGARALGNRSILADPRRRDIRDVLNNRIKRRELFRPFAPSILEEAVSRYFERSELSPFMTMTYRVRPERRSAIPASTHIDGTGRLQTVSRRTQPLYWRLISEFENLTGVPVLLNTSFNENEPIVCTPVEAIECFARTRMDVLVLGSFVVSRGDSARGVENTP
jgi:carbamoyltransferase